MMQGANFDEVSLRLASLQVAEYINQFMPEADRWEHAFSETYETRKNSTIIMVENGTMPQNRLREGWQYYARKGLVAAFIGGAIICVTMPEQVMAGCQTVIHFVKTVLPEYTQYEFSTDTEDDSEFVELTFGYFPENTHDFRIEEEEGIERRYIFEVGDSKLFILCQEKLIKEMKETYIVDTENSEQKMVIVQGDSVRLIKKGEQIQYIWLRGNYKITGLSNLSQEELINILEHIQ